MNTVPINALKIFYENNDDTFYPKLSTQVNSIEEYVTKIRNNAEIFEAYDNDILVGIVAIYLNDVKTKIGFITSVIIDKKYQGYGIGNKLIEKSINYAKENGFIKIILEVFNNNIKAISLYAKQGFEKLMEGDVNNDFIKMELLL